MKSIKGVWAFIVLSFLLLIPVSASYAEAVDIIRNGDFSQGLDDWIVNPEIDPTWNPLSDGVVSLHPPSVSGEGFQGTVIYQNLNVTGIAGNTLHFSMHLLKVNAWEDKTIEVLLTYVDTGNNVHDVGLVSPDNATVSSDPENITPVTADYQFPADARKLIKIGIKKIGYGEFRVDNVSLTADGLSPGSIPHVTGISPASGDYGTSLTITGTGFGTTEGLISIGGSSEGITITHWSDTTVTVTVGEPARSGRVYVVADYVESNPDLSFTVTSPHATVDVMDDDVTVIKGQTAYFVVALDFKNGFTTEDGIDFTLMDPGGTIQNPVFTPVPIKNPGGVLLKIDTANLGSGKYPLLIQAIKGGNLYCSVPIFLEVVTVSDIKFYEYTDGNKDYITSKNVTTQGTLDIYCEPEAYDLAGNPIDIWSIPLTLESGNTSAVAVYACDYGGYNIYAAASGSATLTATTPDGFSSTLDVTVDLSQSPTVSATLDGQSTLSISNADTATHTFSASSETALTEAGDWDIFDTEHSTWEDDNKRFTKQFTLKQPAPLGTYLFYAKTSGAVGYAALTIYNDRNTYSAISGGTWSVDPSLPPWDIEWFTLEFYAESGAFSFSRSAGSCHSGGRFSLAAIPPGSYYIKCVPSEYAPVKPQWYPNATSMAGAEPVTFTAGQETGDICFFFKKAEKTTTLSGRVTSDAPGYTVGVSGAEVTVSGEGATYTATTAQDGTWQILEIPEGVYTITVRALNHEELVLSNINVTGATLDIGSREMMVAAGPPGGLWDSNRSSSLDLADIIYGLQVLSGLRPE
ncbi:MAG: carboxypeptidase regulatory-like domain-containing protein [Deltaproteobacteria bacterium]|nr:carboxypeptidase regulatory-like domain-containing protein [Deltaproteobacteria bacterium]